MTGRLSWPGTVSVAQRQAGNANARLDQNIDRVAAQAIQLRDYQHIVAFQPVQSIDEAGTLFDRGRA